MRMMINRYLIRESKRCFSTSANAVIKESTFRYENFQWVTSQGKSYDYQYVVAEKMKEDLSSSGQCDDVDILDTSEIRKARLKQSKIVRREGQLIYRIRKSRVTDEPTATIVFVPPMALVTSGKEEVRALTKILTDGYGYRCLTMEWPGWTLEGSLNWAMHQCKLPNLKEEYEEFMEEFLMEEVLPSYMDVHVEEEDVDDNVDSSSVDAETIAVKASIMHTPREDKSSYTVVNVDDLMDSYRHTGAKRKLIIVSCNALSARYANAVLSRLKKKIKNIETAPVEIHSVLLPLNAETYQETGRERAENQIATQVELDTKKPGFRIAKFFHNFLSSSLISNSFVKKNTMQRLFFKNRAILSRLRFRNVLVSTRDTSAIAARTALYFAGLRHCRPRPLSHVDIALLCGYLDFPKGVHASVASLPMKKTTDVHTAASLINRHVEVVA